MTEVMTRGYLRNSDGISITADLRKAFPSVFATKASPKMSEDYKFFPSHAIVDEMLKAGMLLVEIRQQHSLRRDPAYQMHSLRFRPSNIKLAKVGDTVAELQLLNSHNGFNRMAASSGLFRLACKNGMVVADSLLGSFSAKHIGQANTFEAVRGMITALAERLPLLRAKVDEWRSVLLKPEEQVRLAKMLGEIRNIPDWVRPDQLLESHREVDAANRVGNRDFWTTFNVIQENAISRSLEKGKDERKAKTRPLSGALANYNVNRLFWAGAEQALSYLKEDEAIPLHFDPEAIAKPAAAAHPAKGNQAKATKVKPGKAAKAKPEAKPGKDADAERKARAAEASRKYREKKRAEAAAMAAAQSATTKETTAEQADS